MLEAAASPGNDITTWPASLHGLESIIGDTETMQTQTGHMSRTDRQPAANAGQLEMLDCAEEEEMLNRLEGLEVEILTSIADINGERGGAGRSHDQATTTSHELADRGISTTATRSHDQAGTNTSTRSHDQATISHDQAGTITTTTTSARSHDQATRSHDPIQTKPSTTTTTTTTKGTQFPSATNLTLEVSAPHLKQQEHRQEKITASR